MIAVNIRKQGGAAIMTIPADILKMLDLQIGSQVELDILQGNLVVHPVRTQSKRYTLKEILEGVTPEAISNMKKETAWAREGDSVGREIS